MAVPGLFVSHCLKFDLLSSGKSNIYFVISLLGMVRQFSVQRNQTMGSVVLLTSTKTESI